MSRALFFVMSVIVLSATAACSSPPLAPPETIASQWRCSKADPKDTFIPVVLEKDSSGKCHARVVPPGSTTETPRVCTGNKAIWQVTNKCGARLEVTFAFNPFTKDSSGMVNHNETKEIKSPVVRDKARESTGAMPAYKYDIMIGDEIDLDPEIQIERRR